jgi:hypothetical protein
MALFQSRNRLEVPSMSAGNRASMSLSIPMDFYSSTSLSSSTSNLNFDPNSTTPLSPRTLYAQTFDRPLSSRSLPSRRFARKNMKEMTGFGTTEEEFEALPIAVRRKVRQYSIFFLVGEEDLKRWRWRCIKREVIQRRLLQLNVLMGGFSEWKVQSRVAIQSFRSTASRRHPSRQHLQPTQRQQLLQRNGNFGTRRSGC